MASKFDQIRPFENSDLPEVLNRLVNNPEFIKAVVAYRFMKWPKISHTLCRVFLKYYLKSKARNIQSLRQFQSMIEPYMQRMIKNTTSALTTTGLDSLDLSKPCLFISNHRDIALDPAFVNWVLHINQQDTVRIAVGDNLLSTNWVTDVLRLNKCFIVERSITGRREKLKAAKLLSEYIHYTLKTDQQHIWIAQREGRAKDGVDVTNPAILSMLLLNKPKEIALGDYIASLRIIPVSISYEFDPCDINKAKELYQAEREGNYDKPDNEDMRSIVNGIKGQKGRVNVHFGTMVKSQYTTTKEIAQHIDAEILQGYKAFSTSQVALARLNNKVNAKGDVADEQNYHEASLYLDQRLATLNKDEQIRLLSMYANPILRAQVTD